jgi:hypothetical protein
MGWLDIIGGMISFYVGAVSSIAAASHSTSYSASYSNGGTVGSRTYSNIGGVLFLCLGLVAMWIAGLVTRSASSALAWWNCGFACAYGLLAIKSVRIRGGMAQVPFSTEEREQQRSGRAA